MSISQSANQDNFCRNEKVGDLLQYANVKRKTGLFNDINIQVGKKRFSCNKMVLSCYSSYFEKMFQIEMQEKYQETVDLTGFDEKTIELLLSYMYGEQIFVNNDNIFLILGASDYLQLHDVKKFCFEFFAKNLSVENCLDVLKAYNLYVPSNLSSNYIYQFIAKHFNAVLQQEKLREFSVEDLTSFLTNLNKNQVNQKLLLLSIIFWINHDQELRIKNFTSLFKLIDLSIISCEFLSKVLSAYPFVTDNRDCLNSFISTLAKKLNEQTDCSKILSIGGKKQSNKVIEVHNIFGRRNYPKLPVNLSRHRVEKVNNFLYCIGGIMDNLDTNATASVYRMNLNFPDLKWEEVAPMIEKRCYHGSCAFQSNIVVSGGFFYGDKDSVEIYKFKKNKWEMLPEMNNRRSGHGMVVCDGSLYVVGGNNLSSVEKLKGVEGSWEYVQPMNTPRDCLAAVCLDGTIYAIGGSESNRKSVEKFIPGMNEWRYVSEMNKARIGMSACIFRGKIFVIGGDMPSEDFSTIECYDPASDKWSIVSDHVCSLQEHVVVAV